MNWLLQGCNRPDFVRDAAAASAANYPALAGNVGPACSQECPQEPPASAVAAAIADILAVAILQLHVPLAKDALLRLGAGRALRPAEAVAPACS